MELFETLHEFWASEKNSDQGLRAKLLLGRECHASAGVVARFVPMGVEVMHGVLLTAEGPVSDAVSLQGNTESRGSNKHGSVWVIF